MNTQSSAGYGRAVTDRGRRLADAVALAQVIGGSGRWLAARLSDGGTDGKVYDTKADAVRHQLHETQCAYMVIPAHGVTMTGSEASQWLELHESMYAAGYRLSDANTQGFISRDMVPGLNRAARRRAERESARLRHPTARRSI